MRQQIGESREIKGPMSDRATQEKIREKSKKRRGGLMHQIHSEHGGEKDSSGCGRSDYTGVRDLQRPKSIRKRQM